MFYIFSHTKPSGELHALKWEQIALENNLILVVQFYDSNVKIVAPSKVRYWRTIPSIVVFAILFWI
jgi:hypothetical protein